MDKRKHAMGKSW